MMPPSRSATLAAARGALRAAASDEKAAVLQRFFKTGPGEYGEGDRFLGVTVPATRAVARRFRDLPWAALERLLASAWHEERLLALLMLIERYDKADAPERTRIHRFYLAHTDRINNWDLVDLSAPTLVGQYLLDRRDAALDRLACSRRLWERRIAIVATHAFIRAGRFDPTLRLAARLLGDPEDLMHKAVGWMLREVGKRDESALLGFLEAHAVDMPRTALRYAIERMPELQRRAWMARR